MRRVLSVLVLGSLLFAAPAANAALTSSEKAQIKDFVTSARKEDAGRVRALVARTDLTTEESIKVMTEATQATPWSDARGVFFREMLFGGASTASRPLLVHVVTRAALARADGIYQKYVGGLDHEPRAIAELMAIYGFLDGEIANAGKPGATHDVTTGITAGAYEDCSKALREHVDLNARWVKGDGVLPESALRLRAQAQVTLIDMLPDGVGKTVDAADRLGLKGPRRQILTDWGILLADGAKLDDPKVEQVRQLLGRLPAAREGLEVLAFDATAPLRARGAVTGATIVAASPFGTEVTSAPGFDAPVSALVHEIAIRATRRALDARSALREQAQRDAALAQADTVRAFGSPRAPSVDHLVGAALHLVLLDAPKATELGAHRFLGGHPASAALLSDALGVLVEPGAKPKAVEVGRDGKTAPMTQLTTAASGAVTGFTLEGHAWSLDRAAPNWGVFAIRRDEHAVKASDLTSIRARPKP